MTAALIVATVLLSGLEALRGLRWGLAPALVGLAGGTLWLYPDLIPLPYPELGIPALLGTVALFHSDRNHSLAECLLPTLMFVSITANTYSALGVTLFLTTLAHGLHQLETQSELSAGPLALRLTLSLLILIGGTEAPSPVLETGLNGVAILWLLTLPSAPHFAFVFGVQGILVSLMLPDHPESLFLLATAGICGVALGARPLLGSVGTKQKSGSLMAMLFCWFLVLRATHQMHWIGTCLWAMIALIIALRGLQWRYASHSPEHWKGALHRSFTFWFLLQFSSVFLILMVGTSAAFTPLPGVAQRSFLALVIGLMALCLGTLSWVPSQGNSKPVGRPGWHLSGLAIVFLTLGVSSLLFTPLPAEVPWLWMANVLGIGGVGYWIGKNRWMPLPTSPQGSTLFFDCFRTLGATVERLDRLVVDRLLVGGLTGGTEGLANRLSDSLSQSPLIPWLILAAVLLSSIVALSWEGLW